MGGGIKLKNGVVSSQRSVRVAVGERAKDILVFVPGTTDPINATPAQHQANQSYFAENKELLEEVKKLKKEYLDLHILDHFYSWSGDNAKDERAKAGDRLRQLLYARKDPAPVYQGFLDKPVSLHLIGHSHGGNVINEFTKSIKEHGDFPKRWKIKSITYLSTPFFSAKKKLHQLDRTYLHPECRVINVRNDFDLTQRVIADFTLRQLPAIVDEIKADSDIAAARTEAKKLDTRVFEVLESLSPIDDAEEGPALWDATIEALGIVHKGLQAAKALVDCLSVSYPDVISATLKTILGGLFTALSAWSASASARFKARRALPKPSWHEDRYDTIGFVSDLDLLPLLHTFSTFLSIQAATRSGPLVTVIDQLLVGRIDVVDDTVVTPEAQLTPAIERHDVQVRRHDLYDGQRDGAYDAFIQALEEAQKTYAGSETPFHRSDVVLRLLAQLDYNALRTYAGKLDKLEYVLTGQWDDEITSLRRSLETYATLLDERNAHLSEASDFVAGLVAGKVAGLDEKARSAIGALLEHPPANKRLLDLALHQLGAPHKTTIHDLHQDLKDHYTEDPRFAAWLDQFVSARKLPPRSSILVLFGRMYAERKSVAPLWEKWDELPLDKQRGSVAYLAIVSHSVSRQKLYPEVHDLLVPAFESGKNPGYKPAPKQAAGK